MLVGDVVGEGLGGGTWGVDLHCLGQCRGLSQGLKGREGIRRVVNKAVGGLVGEKPGLHEGSGFGQPPALEKNSLRLSLSSKGHRLAPHLQ